jgi:hypothetical protein
MTMKMKKSIASVLFLVFIYIISLRGHLMKANQLNTERNQPVSHSSTMSVAVRQFGVEAGFEPIRNARD